MVYTPLHVSSTIVLIFRRTIVLVQHLVSPLWKQVNGLYSSTCFEHYCAHLQEDNCISTASGIITLETSEWFILLYMFRALLCSSSGGQLYYYSIWYRQSSGDCSDHTLRVSSRNLCTEQSPKESDDTRCCTNTTALLKMSTVVLETCRRM